MSNLAWMVEAEKHKGIKEIGTSNSSPIIDSWVMVLSNSKVVPAWLKGQAWCGTFVAHCLKKAGVKYPKYWYRALDYLNYGTKLSKPAYGCVAIKSRVGGGHVCFVMGRDKKTGKLVCLGGNQSNSVCYALYNESDFEQFRWYGLTGSPAASRYTLPIYTNVTATGVTEA